MICADRSKAEGNAKRVDEEEQAMETERRISRRGRRQFSVQRSSIQRYVEDKMAIYDSFG